MKIPDLFKEYIWLVNTIYRAKKISLSELNDRWLETEMSGGVDIARTTFSRHKDAIEEIFGIYIECDRKDGYRYYIGNPEVLEDDTVQNWMLSTMSLSNIISESLSLQERIIAERISVDEDILEQLSFFDDYYGVVIDEELPTERIVLRAYRDERFELRDVPLHHSQHFMQWNNDEDFADLEVRLKPTHDFINFLISKCDCLQVLSPQSVIDQLRERMERGLNMYKINQ